MSIMTPRGRKKTDDSEESKKHETKKTVPVTSKDDPVKFVEQEKPIESTKKPEPEPKKVDQPKKSEHPKKLISHKSDNSKPKIEFNLSDGVTWRDFAALVLIFFKFFWWIAKIILWPVFWIWAQNVKIKRFILASDQDRVMTEDERLLFESVPTVFILTGLIGGILLGILVGYKIKIDFDTFFSNLKANFITGITDPIGNLLYFLYHDVLIGIGQPLLSGFMGIYNSIKSLYDQNPIAAFSMLVIIGIVVTILWITLQEKFGFRVAQLLRSTFGKLFETPQKAYDKFLSFYRSFNRKLTEILIGKERLRTRTQVFFKKTMLFTSVVAIWTFIAGIYIALSRQYAFNDTFSTKIIYTSIVLIVAGFISGIIIFALITRYFDLMNRKKYIASEFIKEPRF